MKITDIENYMQFPNFVIKGNKMMLEKAEKELVRLGCTNDHYWNSINKKNPNVFIKVWNSALYQKPYFYYLTETRCIEETTPVINLTETKLEKVKHYFMDKWFVLVAAGIMASYITVILMTAIYFMGMSDAQCRWYGGILFGASSVLFIQHFRSKRK